MADFIRQFINSNRRSAAWLESRFPRIFGAPSYKDELMRLIENDIGNKMPGSVLEVGGIDRPLLKRGQGFKYLGLDIEEREGCNQIYDQFIVQSIEEAVPVKTDLIISITLMEHVPDNKAAVTAMFNAIQPGGGAYHYIPSKWHPYSIALRLLGPNLQRKLIPLLRPAAAEVTGYPAFFNHCSPYQMARLFREGGFQEIRIKAFYRASDYFAFFLPAYLLVALYENLCSVLDLQFACSGFIISARRNA